MSGKLASLPHCATKPASRRQAAALLRKARHKLGLSQEEAARIVGVSCRSYGAWERGDVPMPHLEALIVLEDHKTDSGLLTATRVGSRSARPVHGLGPSVMTGGESAAATAARRDDVRRNEQGTWLGAQRRLPVEVHSEPYREVNEVPGSACSNMPTKNRERSGGQTEDSAHSVSGPRAGAGPAGGSGLCRCGSDEPSNSWRPSIERGMQPCVTAGETAKLPSPEAAVLATEARSSCGRTPQTETRPKPRDVRVQVEGVTAGETATSSGERKRAA
jgi:DNA-binding XRE family transcriptional regulator